MGLLFSLTTKHNSDFDRFWDLIQQPVAGALENGMLEMIQRIEQLRLAGPVTTYILLIHPETMQQDLALV